MNSKHPIAGPWLYRLVFVLIIVFSGAIMYLVDRIDKIIHVQLYGFGLQPSLEWMEPYWFFARIINVSLGIMIILSAVLIALSFIKIGNKDKEFTFKQEINEQNIPKTQPIVQAPTPVAPQIQSKPVIETSPPPQIQTPVEPKQIPKTKINKTKANTLPVSTCPSCRKTFTQPLVMLDFENGKSKLVNVCPYCNQVLGDNEEKID